MISISEITRLVLSIFIVLFSLVSVYYGIRYLSIPDSKKDKYHWYSWMITALSAAWAVSFSYISISIVLGLRAVVYDEFAVVIARPLLLIMISLMAIYQRMKYTDAKTDIEIKRKNRLEKGGDT
jgi:choline-glycine betaine transporter